MFLSLTALKTGDIVKQRFAPLKKLNYFAVNKVKMVGSQVLVLCSVHIRMNHVLLVTYMAQIPKIIRFFVHVVTVIITISLLVFISCQFKNHLAAVFALGMNMTTDLKQ